MPDIQAFCGLRYDLGHVGSLGDVIAPPYDVIDPSLQDQLYKRHPANVIRLILNRDEPGDAEPDARYRRAARYLKQWREEGILAREADPSLYVYHQEFTYDEKPLIRRGFMCRLRLERFGEGKIYPHEETHAAAKADRLKLTRACRANLSQIFGLYPDPQNEAQQILEDAIAGSTPLECSDHLGVVHRLWPVSDVETISRVASILGPKPMYVADGHHRYETACNYRDELSQAGLLSPDHPANSVMAMCVSMNDPGMVVLPTHRLFRGLPALTAEELVNRLEPCFSVRIVEQGPQAAHAIWEEIEVEGSQGTMALFTRKGDRWLVLQITEQGKAKMAAVASEHTEDWQSLGVSILHRLIIDNLLEVRDLPKPTYVHLVDELVDGLTGPDAREYPLAALVMPATVEHIRAISEHGERMPAKSTYFYPKLLSGLVINPLD